MFRTTTRPNIDSHSRMENANLPAYSLDEKQLETGSDSDSVAVNASVGSFIERPNLAVCSKRNELKLSQDSITGSPNTFQWDRNSIGENSDRRFYDNFPSQRLSRRSFEDTSHPTPIQERKHASLEISQSRRRAILGEPKPPNGSFISGKSAYDSRLTMTSYGGSAHVRDSVPSPLGSERDVERTAAVGPPNGFKRYNQDEEEDDEPCWLDRQGKKFQRQFGKVRTQIGLASLFAGIGTFVAMTVLLSMAEHQKNKRCARAVFCTCGIVITFCFGLFAAAMNRSLGEVVILMTFVLCVGILISSHLDPMMGFPSSS